MSLWLSPLRQALDAAPDSINFFFRDDDIGWGDDCLFELLDLFEYHALPLDLAVIPEAMTPELARTLEERSASSRSQFEMHQHGFVHLNHESLGRKCEFGPSRSIEMQRRDIEAGWRKLTELLGPSVRPFFTPPWNRCTAETGECLAKLGFRVLSRDFTADPLRVLGLAELPVCIDWCAKKRGVRLNRAELGALMAERVKTTNPVGIMFHHEWMNADERKAAGELLALLASHPHARCSTMRAIVEKAAGTVS
jgi:hypothetical protein